MMSPHAWLYPLTPADSHVKTRVHLSQPGLTPNSEQPVSLTKVGSLQLIMPHASRQVSQRGKTVTR